MWESYFTPDSVPSALKLLSEHPGQARVIAGGTDIMLEFAREARPGIHSFVDISRIPGLDQIRLDSNGLVHIGPLVTHNHVASTRLLVNRAFPLAQASWSVASPQIRNRATVAGNIITASPANDTIPPLIALNAEVTLISVAGERDVPLRDFYTGVRKTIARPDELMTDIRFRPLDSPAERGVFIKLGLRRALAVSIANVAVVLRFEGNTVVEARITQGAVAPTIISSPEAERFLVGKRVTSEVVDQAADLAARACTPIDDLRGSAVYRREMIRVLTHRALTVLRDGRERADFPEKPVMLWGVNQGRVESPLLQTCVHRDREPIETTVNGTRRTIHGANRKTMLRMLREDVGLTGTKEGCAEGECGACTVFLDGMAVMACIIPAPRAHNAAIVTVEGLARHGHLHPIQQAFIEQAAVQCGYCTPGLLMAGAKLLDECPEPTIGDIQQAVTGNLCRCTGYYSVVSAIERAACLSRGADRS
jgi:carbon-monoxide dehydrogenase medium subunit